ncbi:MAG: hypothetical protein ABJE10_12795, partial [bacterium]
RLVGNSREGERGLRLRLLDPASAWGRAGLHTGDLVVSMNGAVVASWPELRSFLLSLHVGDIVHAIVSRAGGQFETRVTMSPYDRPVATLRPLADASPLQKAIREQWLAGR